MSLALAEVFSGLLASPFTSPGCVAGCFLVRVLDSQPSSAHFQSIICFTGAV